MDASESPSLPAFVRYPIFPFEGDLRPKQLEAPREHDHVRSGEPGGPPCELCAAHDDEYIWVDEHWRVRSALRRTGVPVQLFLESREHVDMDGLEDDRAADLGRLIVALDRAVQAVGGIGRVHVNRWGDGGSHFHMWIYGRPRGALQLLGFCLPLWAQMLPPTPADAWERNLATVAGELAKRGGHVIGSGRRRPRSG